MHLLIKTTVLSFTIFCCFSFSGCAHEVSPLGVDYTHSQVNRDASIVLVIPPESRSFIYAHDSGPEKWKLLVGRSVTDIAQDIFSKEYGRVQLVEKYPDQPRPGINDRVVEIRIESFEASIAVLKPSDRKAEVTLRVEVYDGSHKKLWSGVVLGDSDAESQASRVSENVLRQLIMDYSESLRSIMTKSALDGVTQILAKVKEGQGAKTSHRAGTRSITRLPQGGVAQAASLDRTFSPAKDVSRLLEGQDSVAGSSSQSETGETMPAKVSVFLGSKNGTFENHGSFSTGMNPGQLAVGDFDGDGALDIATGESSCSVTLHFGNGDGSFRNQISFGTQLLPKSVATGDFNGDGVADLVAVSQPE